MNLVSPYISQLFSQEPRRCAALAGLSAERLDTRGLRPLCAHKLWRWRKAERVWLFTKKTTTQAGCQKVDFLKVDAWKLW